MAGRLRDFELDYSVEMEVFGRVFPTVEEMTAEAERVWAKQPECLYFSDSKGNPFSAWDRTVTPVEFRPTVPEYSRDLRAAWRIFDWLRDHDVVRLEACWAESGAAHFVWIGEHEEVRTQGRCRPTLETFSRWWQRKPIGLGDDVCTALCNAGLRFAALKREHPKGLR